MRAARVLTMSCVLALHGCAGATQKAAPSSTAAPDSAATAGQDADASARLPDDEQPMRVGEELIVRRVARDAYVITHDAGVAPANVLAVRMPDGTVVLCSSPYHTEATRAMLAWLRGALDPPRIVAINTHFHPDGTGGNEAYAQAGVETYASDLTQGLLETRGAEVRDMTARMLGPPLQERIERVQIVPAQNTFDAQEGLRLRFGGESLHVFHPGAAHSPDNVVVHFPAQQVLFGGCMIRAATAGIGYTGDADVAGWAAAAEAVKALGPRVVIPGHGEPGGIELIQHTVHVARAAQDAR